MTLTPFLLGQKVTSLVTILREITRQWHCWNQSYPGKKDRWILWSLLIQFSAKIIVILLGRHRSHLEGIVKLLLRFALGAGWQPILYDWVTAMESCLGEPANVDLMVLGGWWSRRSDGSGSWKIGQQPRCWRREGIRRVGTSKANYTSHFTILRGSWSFLRCVAWLIFISYCDLKL